MNRFGQQKTYHRVRGEKLEGIKKSPGKGVTVETHRAVETMERL